MAGWQRARVDIRSGERASEELARPGTPCSDHRRCSESGAGNWPAASAHCMGLLRDSSHVSNSEAHAVPAGRPAAPAMLLLAEGSDEPC
jgi:hypothetical protein